MKNKRTRRVGVAAQSQQLQVSTRPAIEEAPAEPIQTTSPSIRRFFYEGVVFDMDGTLTEAHIDFADMRSRTGIPVGDLFTVMEAWTEPAAIARSMGIILDIEAEAAKGVRAKEGLFELLAMLKERNVRVALVTRNTTASVQAFLDLIGPEWASLFSIILTREFPFVKPDTRLLVHIAEEWGVPLSRLLMVGDSLEDVEVGNAAGTASCLVAGGGNEKPGSAPTRPPPGAAATFTVSGLPQLTAQLVAASDAVATRAAHIAALQSSLLLPSATTSMIDEGSDEEGLGFTSVPSSATYSVASGSSLASFGGDADGAWVSEQERTPLGVQVAMPGDLSAPAPEYEEQEDDYVAMGGGPLAGRVRLGWPARVAAGQVLQEEGAPPPGLSFIEWLVAAGALRPGACSFPVIGRAAGGLATCAPQECGDRVLHVCCGQGGLTKLLASQGMKVVGVDTDVAAAHKRGLSVAPFNGTRPLARHSLKAVRSLGPFDVLLLCSSGSAGEVPDHWWSGESLSEIQTLLPPGGRLCAQVDLPSGTSHTGRGGHGRGAGGVNPAAIINSINSNGMTVVAWQLLPSPPGALVQQLRLVARPHLE